MKTGTSIFKEDGYEQHKAARIWKKLARSESRLNLLRKLKLAKLGTKNVEDFLFELRENNQNFRGDVKNYRAWDSYPDGNQEKKHIKPNKNIKNNNLQKI